MDQQTGDVIILGVGGDDLEPLRDRPFKGCRRQIAHGIIQRHGDLDHGADRRSEMGLV